MTCMFSQCRTLAGGCWLTAVAKAEQGGILYDMGTCFSSEKNTVNTILLIKKLKNFLIDRSVWHAGQQKLPCTPRNTPIKHQLRPTTAKAPIRRRLRKSNHTGSLSAFAHSQPDPPKTTEAPLSASLRLRNPPDPQAQPTQPPPA